MSPPSKSLEPPNPTPRVCVCGYDLTGLPASAGAKCPECGHTTASALDWRDRTIGKRWLVVGSVAPPFVFVAAFCHGAVITRGHASTESLEIAAALGGVAWLISFPAAIRLARLNAIGRSPRARRALPLAAFFACLLGHPIIAYAMLWGVVLVLESLKVM